MADENIRTEQETYVTGERVLFGRRQIFCTVDDINEDNIISEVNSALSIHIQNLMDMEYLYWYRRGLQPVLNRSKEVRPEINHHIVENHAAEIVDFKNGYFLTKPAFYISRSDDEEVSEDVKELNEYLYRSGKQEADNQLVDWFHTVGRSVLYVTPNESRKTPVLAYALDPRNAFVAYDLKPGNEPVLACNLVVRDGKLQCDAYTKEKVYRLSGTMVGQFMTNDPVYMATVDSLDAVEPNVLKEIPIIEYQYNSVLMGAFEAVIPLLNAINEIQSDRENGVDQFIQSLAVAVNVDLDDGITANDIRKAGMIVLKSIGENKADFKILSEQLNQTETQVLVDHLYEQVLNICGMPKTDNSRFGGSTTGVAELARNGWYQADTVARNTEDLFIKANRQFDKIFLDILKRKNLLSLEPSDIKLQIARNETANVQSKAQAMYTMLGAGLAPELALAKSGISNDPVTDVAQSKKYLNLIWGDPDAVVERTVEGAMMATPEAPASGVGGGSNGNETQRDPLGEEEEKKKVMGQHWVNGYWKSN